MRTHPHHLVISKEPACKYSTLGTFKSESGEDTNNQSDFHAEFQPWACPRLAPECRDEGGPGPAYKEPPGQWKSLRRDSVRMQGTFVPLSSVPLLTSISVCPSFLFVSCCCSPVHAFSFLLFFWNATHHTPREPHIYLKHDREGQLLFRKASCSSGDRVEDV